MANQIPLSGATDAAGGYLLPTDQGDILTNGVLQSAGALQLAGDSRSTSSRKETFAIWQGTPTAEFVGEGGTKPVTGAEFGAGTINVKKVATIVTFTDEMLEDVQNGDLNVLVDGGIREAISDVIDANAIGLDSGTAISGAFDVELVGTSQVVEYGTGADALKTAVSAAMGSLEANGYTDLAVLHSSDLARHLRDARAIPGGGTLGTVAGTEGLYDDTRDPLYGLPRFMSTNLNTLAETAGAGKTVAVVVSRPNLHVRIRKDVTVTPSREASLVISGQTKSLYQEDLTALRYVTRLGFWVHDLNRAVVKINNAS
jgi:HK97 family phage major capsid protein